MKRWIAVFIVFVVLLFLSLLANRGPNILIGKVPQQAEPTIACDGKVEFVVFEPSISHSFWCGNKPDDYFVDAMIQLTAGHLTEVIIAERTGTKEYEHLKKLVGQGPIEFAWTETDANLQILIFLQNTDGTLWSLSHQVLLVERFDYKEYLEGVIFDPDSRQIYIPYERVTYRMLDPIIPKNTANV